LIYNGGGISLFYAPIKTFRGKRSPKDFTTLSGSDIIGALIEKGERL